MAVTALKHKRYAGCGAAGTLAAPAPRNVNLILLKNDDFLCRAEALGAHAAEIDASCHPRPAAVRAVPGDMVLACLRAAAENRAHELAVDIVHVDRHGGLGRDGGV